MKKIILVHYNEIGLKGKNQNFFLACLKNNLSRALGFSIKEIKLSQSRFLLPELKGDWQKTLRQVFGVAFFTKAVLCPPKIDDIKKIILTLAKEEKDFASFAIKTIRGDKNFSLNSVEVNKILGQAVKDASRKKVDLENPEKIFWVEIAYKNVFIYTQKIKGPGGLPVGSQGKVLVLLSGGIDSPVAAWQILKRGVSADFIHFHSYPFTSAASQEKVKKLAEILKQYSFDNHLFLVPFGNIQKEILKNCQEKFRVLLYRRLMFKIAEKITKKNHALALVTGESLGQVASQTLENIAVTQEAIKIPILCPLIGFNKDEIIAKAREIGTFETSILPHDDCCTLFLPKHPATRARLEDIFEEEKNIDISRLIRKAMLNIETIENF